MKLRKPDLLFLGITLFLCSWHLDSSLNDNIISRAAMVAAVVEDGTLSIDNYHELTSDKARVGDHYYSEKAPLPALLMIPFWWMASMTGMTTPGAHGLLTESLLRWSGLLVASLPLALIMLWCWKRLRTVHTPVTASWMATLPFLGSFLFIYSGSFYGHLISALFLLYAWDRRMKGFHLEAGLLSSAAVLSEYSLFIFPLVWMIQDLLALRWHVLHKLVLGGLPAIALLFIMNTLITGIPWALPYSQVDSHADETRVYGLALPSLPALHGLFISPYRGMFVFAPITLLCMMVVIGKMRTMVFRRILDHPLVIPSFLLVMLIASHSMWWGGWAIGPRHLSSVAVLLIAAGLPLLPPGQWMGRLFLVLSIWGLVVNFAAKGTIWYSLPSEIQDPIQELIFPSFASHGFTHMQWPVLLGLSPLQATFTFFLAFITSLAALRALDRRWYNSLL